MKRIFLLCIVFIFLVLYAYYLQNSPPPLMLQKSFSVKYGETLKTVAHNLEKHNLIRNKNFYMLLAYVIRRRFVKAGSYMIYKNMSTFAILRKLSRGDIITKKIVIPEGFNLYEIARRLDKHNIVGEDRFIYYAFNRDFLQSIEINAISAEGYLFPDTYVFPIESDSRQIIAAMYRQLKKKLRSIGLGNHDRSPQSIHRMLTMASLIEKEAKIAKERKIIASVFYNRLKINMKLDCDPTVRYAVKKFKGRIRYRDLAYDSPFNTYVRKGLPPTPISSVGRASIIAAIYPAETDFLYFVARKNGSHYFSKNLQEHNRAVGYYILNKKNNFVDNQKL